MEEMLLPGVNEREYLKTYFQSSVELLKKIPIYTVEGPQDLARIDEIRGAILKTLS